MAYTSRGRVVMQSFGHRVRALRIASGLSQADLGKLARVGDRFVGIIERGKGNPSLVTMVLIADALQSDLGDMLLETSSPYVMLRAEDALRAREAITALRSVFPERRKNRKRSKIRS